MSTRATTTTTPTMVIAYNNYNLIESVMRAVGIKSEMMALILIAVVNEDS